MNLPRCTRKDPVASGEETSARPKERVQKDVAYAMPAYPSKREKGSPVEIQDEQKPSKCCRRPCGAHVAERACHRMHTRRKRHSDCAAAVTRMSRMPS